MSDLESTGPPGPLWRLEAGEDASLAVPVEGDLVGWSATAVVRERPGGPLVYAFPAADVALELASPDPPLPAAVRLTLPGSVSHGLASVLATGWWFVQLVGPDGARQVVSGLLLMSVDGPTGTPPPLPDPDGSPVGVLVAEAVAAAIGTAVPAAVATAVGPAVGVAVDVHVADPTPHPAYDDMPSPVLWYRNALI